MQSESPLFSFSPLQIELGKRICPIFNLAGEKSVADFVSRFSMDSEEPAGAIVVKT
jgi:hypothetical protein